jgi:hypothetical protein
MTIRKGLGHVGGAGNLDRINALAESMPGFIWRLQTEEGDATSIRPFENENMLVNMSVWRDIKALNDYVYRSAHVELMRLPTPDVVRGQVEAPFEDECPAA